MAIQTPTAVSEAVAFDVVEVEERSSARARWRPSATLAYIVRRIGLYLVTLWGALTASFLFFRLMPGDPIGAIIVQFQQKGQYGAGQSSAEIVAYYRKVFGLDGSLLEQYLRYMNRVVIHQDFGPSVLSYPTPAAHLIARGLPWTLGLIGTATLIGWLVGVAGGTFVGWARGSRLGSALTGFSLLMSHIPAYFAALFLVFFLAYRYPIFPPSSAYDSSLNPGWNWAFISSVIMHGTLPVLATALVSACGWLIGTRALVINVLGEDYLTFAGAKGLSRGRILNRYVMRNAWLPQIAALGIVMGGVINGNVLVERLFRYPGVGNLLVDAVSLKDVNTAMGIVSLLIFVVLTLNLVIDLCLPLIDPRVKYNR